MKIQTTLSLFLAIGYLLFCLVICAAAVYLFVLIVKALKKYIASKEVREEKKIVAKNLGEVLKEHRMRCQMTQEFVAEALGVSRQSVSKWETGKTYPDIQTLLLLTEVFDVSLDELIKGDVEEMKQEINAQERAGFNRDTVCFAVLGIASVLALAPLVALWDLMGALIWGLLFSSACYFCGRVELYKKMFDIQTYKEILAFQQGADMTALTAVRAERDPRRQRASKAVMVVVAAAIGAAIAYGGMWLLDTLGLF